MRLPRLVAHRGYPLHYPENTLIGIEAAIIAGARYVETDVQLTRDAVPVLFHDRDLSRMCGVNGAVHDYPLARLREFPASEFGRFGYRYVHARIPSLAEFVVLLARHPGVTAFVELKRGSLLRFGVDTVLSRVQGDLEPVRDRCVLISYSLEVLSAARAQGWPALGAVVDRWRDLRARAIAAIRPEFAFCDLSGLPRWGRLAAGGPRVAVFEVADPLLARRLARRGVEFVETFAVGEMRSRLELLAPAE